MRRALFAFLAVASLVHLPSTALAQEWRSAGIGTGARAFFAQGGRPAGVEFQCAAGGRVRTLIAGNGARFASDREATLVLSVDGLAHVTTVTAEDEPGRGGSRFSRTDEGAALRSLVNALKRGRTLEVSSPAGAMTLPLVGSSKALAAIEPGCLGGG